MNWCLEKRKISIVQKKILRERERERRKKERKKYIWIHFELEIFILKWHVNHPVLVELDP